jgi:cytochrome oxidase assembly protein ShyY1
MGGLKLAPKARHRAASAQGREERLDHRNAQLAVFTPAGLSDGKIVINRAFVPERRQDAKTRP